MPTTTINQLKAHPAQMRTTYDLEALATLTLQVFERGLDTWQPIVATPNHGLGISGGGNDFYIVSGHRRHMAQLLAFALRDWGQEHPETEITIEVVRTMLNTLVESLGSLEKVVASLLKKYGEEGIPFVLFEGSAKAQILALQAANYGSDAPDMLGIAHSFHQAVAAGATPEEIARNSGQHLHFVLNHLALMDISPDLAQRIAAGELPMSVAPAVADLPEPKRSGLTIFILANEPGKITAKGVRACAATLKKWSGLTLPLMVKHQSQRNIARALGRLWSQVLDAYPEDAYAAAAMLIFRNLHEEPWATQEKLTLWFQALGGDTYFVNGQIHWANVVQYLVTEVSCDACPIGQLPRQQLAADLAKGQGGPLGMPCRVQEEASRCIHGLAPNDHFDVRVPWEWSQLPGVVLEGGDYRVKSYETLLVAWQAQAAREAQEVETAVSAPAPAASPSVGQLPKKDQPARGTAASSQTAAPQTAATAVTAADNKPAPIIKQRQQIADFMQQHEQLTSSHPFATPCGQCRHRLAVSPTKDEAVPHCAWAGRQRNVSFKLLVVDNPQPDASRFTVPVCRQFAPSQPWAELIPAHPEPAGLPRDWLKAQIRHLVDAGNRHHSDRNTFEFLTGRPMAANENYGDWFHQQLESQGGELSDAQLFTLFVWAHAEWQRANNRTFSLPQNGHGKQFVVVQERPFSIDS